MVTLQNKEVLFCKVLGQVGIKSKEAIDRTDNEAQNLPGLHTTILLHSQPLPLPNKKIHEEMTE